MGQTLAELSDRPEIPYEFVVLDNAIPNAWALPGGKIAINRGLLVQLDDEAELAAVLGHEIVQAAVRLQELFLELREGRKSDTLSQLFASHPPSAERVAANRDRAGELPPGERYKERFARAISQLTHDAPAYKTQKAYTTAIRRDPELFSHSFYRGLVRYEQNELESARTDFLASRELLSTAISAYYLGEIALAENDSDQAIAYFSQAMQGGGGGTLLFGL